MNPMEQFEAEIRGSDPYADLHDHLARNDDRMLDDLVAMRKKKGLSQDVVAARMNRSKTAVSNFERLGADPHLSTIRRYAAAIGAHIQTQVADFDATNEDAVFVFSSVKVKLWDPHRRPHRETTYGDVVFGPWATIG
jgi:transcriptional regulator with XRE-family HTH domain